MGASLVAQTVKIMPAMQETWLDPWVGKTPWRKEWLSTLVFLPGNFHGQRSLAGDTPWGWKFLLYNGTSKINKQSPSHVQLFATPRTVAHQVPLSMEFSRQE